MVNVVDRSLVVDIFLEFSKVFDVGHSIILEKLQRGVWLQNMC